MRFKGKKWVSPFFIISLAVAGLFGASAVVINKQSEETPVVEKAEAAVSEYIVRFYLSTGTWGGIDAHIRKTDSGDYSTMGQSTSGDTNYPAGSTSGNYWVYDMNFTETNKNWIHFYYHDWGYDKNRYWHPQANSGNGLGTTTPSWENFVPGCTYLITVTGVVGDPWNTDNQFSYTCVRNGLFVHYDYDGGTKNADSGTKTNYECGLSTSVTSEKTPTKSGYTFAGWKRSDTGATVSANSSFTTGTTPITMTAQWTINTYTVSFNVQGHGTAPSNQTISYGGKVTKPSNPTASGYYFCGWYKEATCDNEWNFTSDTVTAATTLYALWAYTNPTVYFVSGYNWDPSYVYYWGGDTSVSYPGKAMAKMDAKIYCYVEGDTPGDGAWWDVHIYKYTITGSPTKLQFNNGQTGESEKKTGDLIASNGLVGWYHIDAGVYGDVADFLISFEESMGSYSYGGQTYPKSICNLTDASAFVSRYNTLSTSENEDVVTSITTSKINTFTVPVTSPSTKSDIAIPVLIEQISKNISLSGNNAIRSFTPFELFGEENNIATVIIIVASSVSLLSITVLSVLLVKKRKRKEY